MWHNYYYSFKFFAHRITRHKDNISEIRGYIKRDNTTNFTLQERSTLLVFLAQVDVIINLVGVTKAQPKKQLSAISMNVFLSTYSYWIGYDLLSKDSPAHDQVTLLDRADGWLAEGA